MTLYQFRQYIQYRRKALGRHGLHSPFAYAIVEDVLRNSIKRELVQAMVYYYSIGEIIEDGKRINVSPKSLPKRSVVQLDKLTITTLNKAEHIASMANANNIVMVRDIHDTAEHTAQWQALCAHSGVRMSIDLYSVGLLFFREEFKVKQDFVLR